MEASFLAAKEDENIGLSIMTRDWSSSYRALGTEIASSALTWQGWQTEGSPRTASAAGRIGQNFFK